jgi:virulence-associated protein VagC
MPVTRAFKSGNSQAVRIPADLAYAVVGADLQITRMGDLITIFPGRRILKDAVAALRVMPKPPPFEPREAIELPDRDWDYFWVPEEHRLGALIGSIPVLPFDAPAAEAYGQIIAQHGWIRARDYDRMIAAHAIALGAVLVMRNVADFRDIPGLQWENRFDPT